MSTIIQSVRPLRLLDRQTFTASGTWTKPTDYAGNIASGKAALVKARLMGGGGSGGGNAAVTHPGYASGGKGGEIAYYDLDPNELGATEIVTVAAQSAYGGDGNNTSFGGKVAAGGSRGRKIIDPETYGTTFMAVPAPDATTSKRAGDGGNAVRYINTSGANKDNYNAADKNGYPGAEGTGVGGLASYDGAGQDAASPGCGGGATGGFSRLSGRGARGEALIEVWGY